MKPTEAWQAALEQLNRAVSVLTALGGHQAHSLEECEEIKIFMEDSDEDKDATIADLEAQVADLEKALEAAKGQLSQLMKEREVEL